MASEDNVMMEGVAIVFRNFEGKEGQYNPKGARNFSVLLDDETANAMAADGWNIKWIKQREDDEGEPEEGDQAHLPVSLRFDVFPPNITLVTGGNRTRLDESTVEMLDYAEIQNVDLIVRPFRWDVNGKAGIKAYVKTMFVTIEEDPLVQKYAAMDDPE